MFLSPRGRRRVALQGPQSGPTVKAHSHFLQLALPLQRSWLLQLLLPVPLQLALPLQRTWLLQRSRTCSRSLNLPLELPLQRTWLINVCDPGARTLSQDPQSGPSVLSRSKTCSGAWTCPCSAPEPAPVECSCLCAQCPAT